MYLKRLELASFKTFADRTDLEFHPGITAVVGPNGSGKSNLCDAIRWVLGEQSAHALRGTRMEDFIFAGSQGRRAHGLAQVTLTLDNTDGRLPLEFSEIGVTRRATRGGEGEFLMNGVDCRLRDIQMLFLGTGLGGRSYALIGQGEVDAVLNASPQDRRLLLEEAAGLTRYKRRRRESLRRLEHAAGHLQRLGDLLGELRIQHDRLAEQAEVARQHRAYTVEIRTLEVALVADEARRLRQGIQRSTTQMETARARLRELEEQASGAQREAEESQRLREELGREWEARQRRLLDAVRAQAAAEAAVERAENRMSAHRREEERIEAEATGLGGEVESVLGDLAAVSAERQTADQAAAALRAELDEHRNALRDGERAGLALHSGMRGRLDHLKNRQDAAAERLRRVEVERDAAADEVRTAEATCHRLESRIQALEEAAAGLVDYEDGARTLLLAKREHPDRFAGILGALVDQIEVTPRYRPAIEAALGRRLFCLLVKGTDDLRQALAHLRANGRGPVSFLPLDRVAPRHSAGRLPDAAGVHDWAASFVSAEADARVAVDALLGDVVVVEDLEGALGVLASGHQGRAVTLGGELLSPNGVVTARGGRNGEGSPLERRGNTEANRRSLDEAAAALAALRDRYGASERDLTVARTELERLGQERVQQERALAEVEVSLRIRLAEVEAKGQGLRRREQDFAAMRDALLVRRGRLLGDGAVLAAETHLLEVGLDEARQEQQRLAREHEDLQQRLTALEADRAARDQAHAAALETARQVQEEARAAEATCHRAEVRAAQADAEWEAVERRLREACGLSWEEAEQVSLPLPREEARQRLESLRGLVAALGPVNLRAIGEQEALAARIDRLTRQVEDIEGARTALASLLEHLDRVLRVRFQETFEAVSAEFGRLFVRLFEGGAAHLELLDETPEVEPGLEVIVRLPGKPPRSLAALSGGERVLVALALLFAMLRVHPSPFCVFDEVEAALDDANTKRFATLLRDLATSTQIIIITHNKGTMEAADILYGVTMQEPGVSSVLSVRLGTRPAPPDGRLEPAKVAVESAR